MSSRNLSFWESFGYSLSLLIFGLLFTGIFMINLIESMRNTVPLGHYLFFANLASYILTTVMVVTILSLSYVAINVLFERERSIERGLKIVNILSLISIVWALMVQLTPDHSRAERMLEQSLFNHRENAHLSDIAYIQDRLHCCGVWKYWDWDGKDKFSCDPSGSICTLPRSCFIDPENITTSPFYTMGCQWKIMEVWNAAKDQISQIGVAVFIITVIFRVVMFYILTRINIVRNRNESRQHLRSRYHSRRNTNDCRTMAEWVGRCTSLPEFMGSNPSAGMGVRSRPKSALNSRSRSH